MKNRIIFVLLLVVTLTQAQVENSGGLNPYSINPSFFIDLATYKGEIPGKSKIDIFIKIPYSNIQFIKDGSGYKAGYTITITFMDKDKDNIIFETLWDEDITASNFNATTSGDNYNISYRSTVLAPETYYVRAVIDDLNSDKSARQELQYQVRELENNTAAISSIVLVSDIVKEGGKERIVPSVSNLFTTRDTDLQFFYDIYSPEKKNYTIEYKIYDTEEEKVLYSEEKKIEADSGSKRIFEKIDNAGFSLGRYSLGTEIYSEDKKEKLAEVNEYFISKIYGFPHTITDLQLAIDQMMYIASDSDMDYINEPDNFESKLERYREFWKAKDPSPSTPENEVLTEYYRRVAFSNEKFESYYPGWRTDMGMIYITLGAPDQVDRHPFEFDSKPYEVWDYYQLNRRFIFVDETGFGDYRLINPSYGDWNRYRY